MGVFCLVRGYLCVCVTVPSGHNCSNDLLNVKWTVVGRKHHAGALAGSSLAFHALIVRQLLWSAPGRRVPRNGARGVPGSPPVPPHTTDIVACLRFLSPPNAGSPGGFWGEKSTNHLRNNSFYEFVAVAASAAVSWVGITAGDSLMRAERLPCWLSTPALSLVSRVHRDLKRGLSPALPLPIITFYLLFRGRHSHLHSFSTPSFIYLFPFSVFVYHSDFFPTELLRGGRTRMALKARSETRKLKDTPSKSSSK